MYLPLDILDILPRDRATGLYQISLPRGRVKEPPSPEERRVFSKEDAADTRKQQTARTHFGAFWKLHRGGSSRFCDVVIAQLSEPVGCGGNS